MSRALDAVGEWQAYTRRNPLPDPWWPLKWDDGRHSTSATPYADIARTHPAVFGVWREQDLYRGGQSRGEACEARWLRLKLRPGSRSKAQAYSRSAHASHAVDNTGEYMNSRLTGG